jgi:hypothetical protein
VPRPCASAARRCPHRSGHSAALRARGRCGPRGRRRWPECEGRDAMSAPHPAPVATGGAARRARRAHLDDQRGQESVPRGGVFSRRRRESVRRIRRMTNCTRRRRRVPCFRREGGCTVRPCEERKEGKGEGGSRPRRTPEHRRKARHVAACRPTDGRTDGAVKREAAVSRRGGQIREQARQGHAF